MDFTVYVKEHRVRTVAESLIVIWMLLPFPLCLISYCYYTNRFCIFIACILFRTKSWLTGKITWQFTFIFYNMKKLQIHNNHIWPYIVLLLQHCHCLVWFPNGLGSMILLNVSLTSEILWSFYNREKTVCADICCPADILVLVR